MSIPKYHEFMKPALELLQDNKKYKRVELYEILSNKLKLTKEDRGILNTSDLQPVYKDRISWALTYLKKAGLIESVARATYKITDCGKALIKENPEKIDKKYLERYDSFIEFLSKKNNNDNSDVDNNADKSPTDMFGESYKIITSSLVDEVLDEVLRNKADFFEELVVKLLVKMGYGGINDSLVTGKSGDEGIDGIVKQDKLGFDEIYIQAKCWDKNSTIGRPEIQKFVGALVSKGANKGAFITTATFSKAAIAYAKEQHACKVILIDGEMLGRLMVEYDLGVSTKETYYIKEVDRDFFEKDI